jgi:non-specific serine/threonine protein kinase
VTELKEKLAAYGTSIRLLDAPVEMDQLEASVQISSVNPEEYEIVSTFKIGQRTYTGFDWMGVLSTGGILQIDGHTHVLDPKSLALIQHVLSVKEAHSRVKKGVGAVRFSRLEILDWLMLRHHGVSVQLPEAEQAVFERLSSLDELPQYPLPDLFSGVLRDYQYYGYCWLRFLYECRFGACLADDMGLGKTIQALVFLTSISIGPKKNFGPHLIVVPPSLVFNWVNEIKRFCPLLNSMVFNPKELHLIDDSVDILITTYDVLRRHSDWFDPRQFHVLVFDEAQYIKNLTAGRTKAARQIKRQFTVALTGTPVENHFGEYFSIMDLVVPGIFGSYGGFQDLLKNSRTDVLLRRTRPFVLRRTKNEILKELPPMVETVDYLPMSPYQLTLYQQILSESRQVAESSFSSMSLAKARVKVLTAILRLRQLCVSPGLLDPQFPVESPKIQRLKELIQELYWEGHHVLVFTQFRRFLDIIEPILKEMKVQLVRMDGTTPVKRRGNLVEQFQTSETPMVFLLSLKTGGVGLNLTKANYVIHVDPWWNPAVEDQASSRAHRIGQSQSVFVNRLIMKDSIEERLMQLKAQKSRLFDDVVNFGGHSGGALTKEDFEFLLSD